MKSLCCFGVFCLLAWCDCRIASPEQQTIAERANCYPPATFVLITCASFGESIDGVLGSDLTRACQTLPPFRFLEQSIAEAQAEVGDLGEFVDGQIFQKLRGCFSGPFEFAVLSEQNQLHWVIRFEIDSENEEGNQLRAKVLASLPKEHGWKPTEDLPNCKTIANPDSTVFLRTFMNEILITSCEGIGNGTSPIGIETIKPSLATTRKFRQSAAVAFKDAVEDSAFQLFVDVNSLLERAVRARADQQTVERALLDIGANEMLAFCGSIQFGPKGGSHRSAKSDSEVDIEARFFLQQGMPLTGINAAIDLRPMDAANVNEIPGDVDYYVTANLDLPKFFLAIGQLESSEAFGQKPIDFNPVFRPRSSGEMVQRALTGVSPLLARLRRSDVFTAIDLSGNRFETFGYLLDKGYFRAIASGSRLIGSVAEHQQMWLDLSRPGKSENTEMVEHFKNGTNYLTLRDDYKPTSPREEMMLDSKAYFFRPAISGEPSGIGHYSNQSILEQMLDLPKEFSLAENPEFGSMWAYLSKSGNPGAYCWFDVACEGRLIFHTLTSYQARLNALVCRHIHYLHQSSDAELNPLGQSQKLKEFETELLKNESWDFEAFRKELGKGGCAIYQTDNGLEFHVVQFRRSK